MKKLFAMLAVVFLASAVNAAQTLLKIEGAKYKPLPIALPDPNVIVPTALSTQLSQDLIATVRSDLSWSSVFEVLSPSSYVADLKKEGLDKKSIKVESWTQIGAEALVKMQFAINGDDLSAEVHIHPLYGNKASGVKNFKGSSKKLKRIAHEISDEILKFFTGEPGMFNSQIVAAKETPRGKQIVILNLDGSEERAITKGSGPHILPTFAPDGDTVLYTSFNNHNADLMQVNIDGTGVKTLSKRPDGNTGAQFSPDGQKIAFTIIKNGGSQIYVGDRSANHITQVTDAFGINISPSFTPDGKKIAFVSSRSGNPQIFMMDVDGQNAKRLTFQGKYNQTPRVSPNGDYIAFTGRDEKNVFDLFLLQISTGAISRITQDQGNNEDPWFSPNGRLIVFTSTRDGNRNLYVSNIDGSMQKRITSDGGYYTPSWGPSK